jgi:hypothetical protein
LSTTRHYAPNTNPLLTNYSFITRSLALSLALKSSLNRWIHRHINAAPAHPCGCLRQSLDIPIFMPQRIRWSRREIELLGKRPDFVVCRMLGRTRYAVQLKRHSLGIPQCWENRRAWTPEEDVHLGTMRDVELARKLKRSVSSVRSRRNDTTSVRFIRTPKRWTPFELRLLGQLPDAEIARRSGRFLASVRNKRVQLGFPRIARER